MSEPLAKTKNALSDILPEISVVHAEDKNPSDVEASARNVSIRSGYVYELGNTDTFKRIEALEEEIGDDPLLDLSRKRVYFAVKRGIDLLFSLAVIVLFSWLYAIVAILVKIDDPKGPVIFKQKRVGKNGKLFTMYKFRSMCVDAEEKLDELQDLNEKTGPVFKIANDPRITRVGKWLRKLSLDELPQFWNVFKGDISVVGPRPALPKEAMTYTPYQAQRLAIKPGITCYWQTRRNRDAISFEEWVDLDLLYVKKCSPLSDIKLTIQTIGVVLSAQGN